MKIIQCDVCASNLDEPETDVYITAGRCSQTVFLGTDHQFGIYSIAYFKTDNDRYIFTYPKKIHICTTCYQEILEHIRSLKKKGQKDG